MIAPARRAACRVLDAVGARRSDLPAALANERPGLADERDRALLQELATGTLRWQREADFLIERITERPVHRIDPAVLVILRLGVFQLLHLDRVPASAVVDDAVNLVRDAHKTSASGFVNAVLRTLSRERGHLPLPPCPADATDRAAALGYLGVTQSHPEWLVARWLDRLGLEEARRWVCFNNEPAAPTIRVNAHLATRDVVALELASNGVRTLPTRWAPHGLTLVSGRLPSTLAAGLVSVQDEGSQLVTEVVGAAPGERILDMCAAPGGKAIAMAGDMAQRGLLVATDVRPRRVRLLASNVRQREASCVRVVRLDGRLELPFRGGFDRVLVDAPCSGLGTLRRDPDIRWRRTEADLAGYARTQRALLQQAATVVRPGGRLIYATCSTEPEENEQVVEWFLSGHAAFEPIDLRTGDRQPAILDPLLDERGRLLTSPSCGLEGFFAAAFRRR